MIPDEEMPRFKATLKNCMRMRNFNILRKDILPVIKEIREVSSRKFDETMFSKKFWSTFLNKEENKDIKDIWVSLPQTKIKSALSQNRVKNQRMEKDALSPNTCASENEKSPSDENILFDKLSFSLKQEQSLFWADQKHQEAQLDDYLNQFDENEPQYSVERFLADTEDIMSQTSKTNSDYNKPIMQVEDTFLGEFWCEWNQRQIVQNNELQQQNFANKEGSFNSCTNDLEFFKRVF